MKSELVGEEVTVSGPPQAIVALACEAAASIATCAELNEGDADSLASTVATAVADIESADTIEARILLVEAGLDITLIPEGGQPAATIEYRV